MTTKEIVPTNGEIELMTPQSVIQSAQMAAKALVGVVATKPRQVKINGEQYLEYEDWQTLGRFYHVAAMTGDAIPIEINGVPGAKAIGKVIDTKTGIVVGGAEAFCLSDEPNWGNKPWFQLASMAQTRAGAKALRNHLAWVAVLAGYRPTPAEELSEDVPPLKAMATDAQIKKIFASSNAKGIPDTTLKTWIYTTFKVEHTRDLTKNQASNVIEAIEQGEIQ